MDSKCLFFTRPVHSWCPTPRTPGVLPPLSKPAWIVGFKFRPLDQRLFGLRSPEGSCSGSVFLDCPASRRTRKTQHRMHRPQAGRPDLRRATDFGLRPNAYRRGSYRLTPANRGFGHLAAVHRPPKPRALSGRGGVLGFGLAISLNCL